MSNAYEHYRRYDEDYRQQNADAAGLTLCGEEKYHPGEKYGEEEIEPQKSRNISQCCHSIKI